MCDHGTWAAATAAADGAADVPISREELHRELMQLSVRIGSMQGQLGRIESMVRSVVRAHGLPEQDVAPAAADEPGSKRRKRERCESN